jgi:hypothetical protein
MARLLLPILWGLLLLPSSNVARFDGLPLDTGPELIGFLLLLPCTASAALRRHFRRLVGIRGPAVPAALVALGLLAVGGKLVLWSSGTYQGFLGCYRYALAPPPTGPCERSFSNPWFRYGVTRIDRAIDFDPETWNLGFLNSSRFVFPASQAESHPWREHLPIEAVWRGSVEQPSAWVARVTYVGEVTLRLDPDAAGDDGAVMRLPPRYGTAATVDVGVAAGRHVFELTYRFDDGARSPEPQPSGPWATLRVERWGATETAGGGRPVQSTRANRAWRVLAAVVDAIGALLLVSVALGYAILLRRDWWLTTLVAIAGVAVSRLHPEAIGLPIAFGLLVALLGLGRALLCRPWRRRLVLAFLGTAYLTFCLVLSSTPDLHMVIQRPLSDALIYESQARTILETWSLEGGEPAFRYQPGFRYWRFLERLVLGEGDPFVVIVGLTLLSWGCLWAITKLWPRPGPSWPRAVPFALGAGLVLGLATSTPVLAFLEAPLSEYPTWVLLPLLFTLLFTTRRPRQWVWGGLLGGVAVLCRLNHLLAILGYLSVFALQRWRVSARGVMLTLALALALLTWPPIHNRYYGGPATTALRIMNVNRAAVAISPSRLVQVHRDPTVRRDLWRQIRGILYILDTRGAGTGAGEFTWLVMRGLQWLWLGTAVVALPRRQTPSGTRALLLVPLLYLVVYLLYDVDIYYPRHILAGHLAQGVSILYVLGRGWTRSP